MKKALCLLLIVLTMLMSSVSVLATGQPTEFTTVNEQTAAISSSKIQENTFVGEVLSVSEETVSPQALPSWVLRAAYKILKAATGRLIDVLTDLDSSTTVTSSYAQLVSEDYYFLTEDTYLDSNNEEQTATLYAYRIEPKVTSSVNKIRVYGHRSSAVDLTTKLAIGIRDDSGTSVHDDVVGTHEFSIYEPESSDDFGTWEVEYKCTSKKKWQLFYQHYYNTGTRNIADAVTLEAENAGVYFGSNNRMFWYSTAVNPVTAQRNANKTAILNMEALNAQFMDNEGKLVDYLRDYDVGDTVRFSDTIRRIEYNVSEDITTFYFLLEDEWIGWPFSGDYRSQYSVGSPLNLSFQVVSIGRYGTYQFESLNYFEQVFAGEKTGTIPSLEEFA